MSYQLSLNQQCHTRDLRSLDCWNDVLVTGGSDKIVKIYSLKGSTLEQISSVDIFEKNILSVRINRRGGDIGIFAGSADGKIYGFDFAGNPLAVFEHDSPVCSIDVINADHFVTGSWDGKGIVWQISTHKKIAEYSNHKHAVAVFYNELEDLIVSGSQDKALACWSWQTGQQKRRKEGAHNDIIREISQVEGLGFITCSNDETLKIWTSELDEINHLKGAHSAFVFTVKSQGLGKYFSAGDDKNLQVWSNDSVTQTLQCPSSIWSITIANNGDIFAGCSDGFLRVFTTDEQRKAPTSILQSFQSEILSSASKKSGMSSEEISKLLPTSEMARLPGKKEGEIRVFRNGLIPEAFMWQGGKWEKIGEVITEGNQGGGSVSQPKYYPGDKYFEAGEYDYIFDVDDESGIPKQIPFNDGGNALEAAEKYCMREGLSKGFIEQIRKFLMANSTGIPRQAIKDSTKQVSQGNLSSTPQCIAIEFTDIKNPDGLLKKITEFNAQIEGSLKLSDRELEHCSRIAKQLENSRTYHSWKLDFKEMDTLKKLLQWPQEYRLPVWDLLRSFLCHYQSEALFSGLDAGFDIISHLCHDLEKGGSEAFCALIFRTLANTMIQNTNKNGIVKHGSTVFNVVENYIKNQITNQNLITAICGFLFNFSVTVFEKKIENEDIISSFARILQVVFSKVNDEDNRVTLLQASANVIFKYQNKRDEFAFVRQYLGDNEVSKDLKILL